MLLSRSRLIRTVVTVLALALTGCSVPRLAYQQADWLLLREMDSYLDLRDGQREHIAQMLETHLSRHRVEHLPGIAKALDEATSRARRGFAESDVRWVVQHGHLRLAESVEFMLPAVVSALVDLSPAQRTHLAQRMAQYNDEYVERRALHLSADEQLRRTTERSVEFIEYWTGTLSAEQIAIISQANRSLPSIADEWLTYTRDRQQALLALLDADAPRPAIAALLREWWVLHNPLPPQLARKRDQRMEMRIKLIARLDATLDSVQREHLVNRLQDLADDARALRRAA